MKKNVLSTIVYLLFLIVFNLIFYITGGTDHPASVWISYIFIHIAYLLMACTGLFVKKGREAAVFGMTLGTISSTYFVVEFIIGIVFIALAMETYKTALIVQVVIAAVYLFVFISNVMANDATAESVERQELEVGYLKEASATLKALMEQITDKAANKKIERVYDLVRSSPSRSNSQVAVLEAQIIGELGNLQGLAAKGDPEEIGICADKIYRLANERNRQLKLSN